MHYLEKFLEEVEVFTPSQMAAVERTCEVLGSLISTYHGPISSEYAHTEDMICYLFDNLDEKTCLYDFVELLKEENNVSFENYALALEQKYPEFFLKREDGRYVYDITAAEQKRADDEKLVMEKWRKENPYDPEDDIPF
jgi:hypothetical protein